MPLSLKDRLSISLATGLGSLIFRLWFKTCPLTITCPELYQKWGPSDRQVIGVTWHRAAIYFVHFFGPLKPAVMLSRSKDGEYLARFAEKFGMIPVRGSSKHGGAQALKELVQHLKNGGKACATVLDGPQGPPRVAKKGMIVLAMETGVPIIPIIWSGPRILTFKKTWDKTMLPKPFSPVFLNAADPIFIPHNLDPEALEGYRLKVEKTLNDLTDAMDQRCGYVPPQ
jgi:lysophospholipid acyltransferase (LPLAT)-like uncharacterized protein